MEGLAESLERRLAALIAHYQSLLDTLRAERLGFDAVAYGAGARPAGSPERRDAALVDLSHEAAALRALLDRVPSADGPVTLDLAIARVAPVRRAPLRAARDRLRRLVRQAVAVNGANLAHFRRALHELEGELAGVVREGATYGMLGALEPAASAGAVLEERA